MLDEGHHAVRVGRRGALEATHAGARALRDEVRVLAKALGGAPPARIARDIDHRREGGVQAVSAGFLAGDARGLLDHGHVPARRQAEADREHGAMAVHHVIGEENGNLQAALLRGGVLERAVVGPGHRVEGAAHAAGGDFLDQLRLRHVLADADEPQLADLLLQGHLADQVGDERVLVAGGGRSGTGQRRRTNQTGRQGQRRKQSHVVSLPQ
ncbi:hypothetical protein D3C86_1327880 [compost metagenome]